MFINRPINFTYLEKQNVKRIFVQ
uniref:Uncharacterized protein n=1 Tax=Tetranychus urticae TaxID=32264 RepID=T1KDS2_TETUR